MRTAYCFDLDGTLTKDEILPLIANNTDVFEEIQTLTSATINGVINFESSLKLRCKLLSDVKLDYVHKIIENVRLYESILDFISKHKENCFVLTGNLDKWIEPLLEKIGCQYYCSKITINKFGRLQKIDYILNKGEAVGAIRNEFDRVIAIGDGMGDVEMFEKADIGIAFGETHSPVRSLIEVSDFIIYEEKALCRLLNML